MTGCLAAVPSNCNREFGFNPDSMVTDVIRAFKAWARYGLPHALQQQQQRQAAGSSSGSVGSSAGLAPNPGPAAAGYGAAALPAGEPPAGVATLTGVYDYTKQPPGGAWLHA